MKELLIVLAIAVMAAPAAGDYYIAGDFNGWNPSGNAMTDMGGGIWSATLQLGPNERHEFKVTIGDWSENWPWSGNSWFYTDAAGVVTITYDTNTYADGWVKDSKRIGVNVDPGTWTAVGDWQGWNNANPATAMAASGGGIYEYEQALAPGWYQYKAVKTGSWDAIGADARSVNADTLWFEATADKPLAHFFVNAVNGTIKVETTAIPEPSSLLALAMGIVPFGALLRRKR